MVARAGAPFTRVAGAADAEVVGIAGVGVPSQAVISPEAGIPPHAVIPANAGIHGLATVPLAKSEKRNWIPAFAGMTSSGESGMPSYIGSAKTPCALQARIVR